MFSCLCYPEPGNRAAFLLVLGELGLKSLSLSADPRNIQRVLLLFVPCGLFLRYFSVVPSQAHWRPMAFISDIKPALAL